MKAGLDRGEKNTCTEPYTATPGVERQRYPMMPCPRYIYGVQRSHMGSVYVSNEIICSWYNEV